MAVGCDQPQAVFRDFNQHAIEVIAWIGLRHGEVGLRQHLREHCGLHRDSVDVVSRVQPRKVFGRQRLQRARIAPALQGKLVTGKLKLDIAAAAQRRAYSLQQFRRHGYRAFRGDVDQLRSRHERQFQVCAGGGQKPFGRIQQRIAKNCHGVRLALRRTRDRLQKTVQALLRNAEFHESSFITISYIKTMMIMTWVGMCKSPERFYKSIAYFPYRCGCMVVLAVAAPVGGMWVNDSSTTHPQTGPALSPGDSHAEAIVQGYWPDSCIAGLNCGLNLAIPESGEPR